MVNLDQDSLIPFDCQLQVTRSSKRIEVSEKVESRVSKLWQNESALRHSLFDGRILAVDRIEVNKFFTQIEVLVVPYRYYMAMLRDADIASELNLILLAVSGICVLEGKVLLGIRSKRTTQYPGCYELVPSGGVTPPDNDFNETVDYKGAFCTELTEETHISLDLIEYLNVIGIYLDSKGKTLDICMECGINSKASKILKWPHSNEEYTEIDWCEGENIFDLRMKGEQFVPASIALTEFMLGASSGSA